MLVLTRKRKKKEHMPEDGPEMSCPLCTKCIEILDPRGNRTGHCLYGGPFNAYVQENAEA